MTMILLLLFFYCLFRSWSILSTFSYPRRIFPSPFNVLLYINVDPSAFRYLSDCYGPRIKMAEFNSISTISYVFIDVQYAIRLSRTVAPYHNASSVLSGSLKIYIGKQQKLYIEWKMLYLNWTWQRTQQCYYFFFTDLTNIIFTSHL